MTHTLPKTIALAGLLLVAGLAARAEDRVTYFDRTEKKAVTIAGKIRLESAAGIKLTPEKEKQDKEISAADILEVEYELPLNLRLEYRGPFSKEDLAAKATREEDRKKLHTEALSLYNDLSPRLKGLLYPQRYVQFRKAQLLTRLAEEDASLEAGAIKALSEFSKDHPDSWEMSACVKLLGRLQEARGDLQGALKTYESLANRLDLAREVRQDFTLAMIRALLVAGKHDDAEKLLERQRATLPANDPMAARVPVYLLRCRIASGKAADPEKELKAILAGNADAVVKALACNTLAEFYQKKVLAESNPDRKRELAENAFWQYLWVDVVYNQDKEEHAEALYHLSKLFEQVKNDPGRAQQCQELLRGKEFAGMRYQRLVAKESK